MDIRKPAGFFTLFFQSFALVNRSVGALAAFTLLAVIFIAAEVFAVRFIPQFFLSFLHTVIVTFLTILLMQLLAVKAEKTGESMAQLSSRAVFPTIYLLLFYLLIGIALAALGFLTAMSRSVWAVGLFLALVFFLGVVPLFFAPMAIALREQGPIQAIHYSWALVKQHYVKVLFTLVLAALLPGVYLAAAGYSVYAGIPLYFANSFDLANLSPVWYAVGAGLVLLYIMTLYVSLAFPILMFLNLDYGYNRGSFDVPEADQLAQSEQNIYDASSVLPANMGVPVQQVKPQAQPEVGVKKASVSSTAEDFTADHLDQVYSPDNAKVQEYLQQEEDRMPTILFDDDMAQQIAQSRQQWEKNPKKEDAPEDDDSGTIKISHR